MLNRRRFLLASAAAPSLLAYGCAKPQDTAKRDSHFWATPAANFFVMLLDKELDPSKMLASHRAYYKRELVDEQAWPTSYTRLLDTTDHDITDIGWPDVQDRLRASACDIRDYILRAVKAETLLIAKPPMTSCPRCIEDARAESNSLAVFTQLYFKTDGQNECRTVLRTYFLFGVRMPGKGLVTIGDGVKRFEIAVKQWDFKPRAMLGKLDVPLA